MIQLIKALLNKIRPQPKYYPKGMNSNIDGLSDLVEIGDNFISAPGSIILAHDASPISHTGKTRVEKTVIGKNVFLGANAVILAGSKIGDGCIIGAGAIVSKTIPPMSVVAGNPGRIIMSVEEYMQKLDTRNVLYDLPDSVSKKHGTGKRYTKSEVEEMNQYIMDQYNKLNFE
jgi:NDP-sugar pyrophosphorylase family protein